MKLRKILIPVLAVPLLVVTTAASSPRAWSIPIPDDFAPEGIAVAGSTFYTGSLWDGDIYRGSLATGDGELLVDEDEGMAVGLKVDKDQLVVARGVGGDAVWYDTRTGERLATRQLAPAGASLINDVIVTKDAAYFTNSFGPQIFRVPISQQGEVGQPETITVTGPASAPAQFGLNGIEATPDGETLIVSHSGLGGVFTVDPQTGVSQEIVLEPSGPLPDSVDGILLDGDTLWVVSNFSNTLTEIELADDLSSGTIVGTITNDDVGGLFRVPTTVAQHGSKLVLVNGRFDQGNPPPIGTGVPPGTDYDVVVVKP